MKSGAVDYARIAAFLGEPFGYDVFVWRDDNPQSDADLVLAVLEKLREYNMEPSLGWDPWEKAWEVVVRRDLDPSLDDNSTFRNAPTPISAISALVAALPVVEALGE